MDGRIPECSGGGNVPFWCTNTAACRLEIDGIIRKCDKAFDSPVSERDIYPELLQKIHQKAIFIYAYSEEVLGYIAVYANDTYGKNAYISLLAVHPEFQKHRIGKNLLRAGMETAANYGMDRCSLEVEKSNLNAINFYRSNGFVLQKDNGGSIYMYRPLT